MLKAFRRKTNKPIIAIRLDDALVAELRAEGQADGLICPLCNEGLHFREGALVRAHFAHWVRSDCPACDEPVELLDARVALFTWLQTKFPETATVEFSDPDLGLPRPVDCWATTPEGKTLAYWLCRTRCDVMQTGDRSLSFRAARIWLRRSSF